MRLKTLFGLLVICISSTLFAQSPPQIPLTGSIGVMGSVAILGGTTVQMPSDANYTLTPAQWSNKTLIITSASSLSATRNVVAPLNKGQEFNIENYTTGGQSIVIIGASGTGVTIANGASAAVFTDGTNYVQSTTVSGGSAGSAGTPQVAGTTPGSFSAGTPNIANAALGISYGLYTAGDSIGTGTDATSTGPGNVAFMNGWNYQLHQDIGGPFINDSIPGWQAAQSSWLAIWRDTNPLGVGIDPIYVSEIGTNDAGNYLGNANQQNIFQRIELGNLSWLSMAQSNKVFAQNCTLAGGMAADPSPLQYGLGATGTTLGASATCVINAPKANDTLTACYTIADTSVGTFTISIDGTDQVDPFSGSTTWISYGDGGALINAPAIPATNHAVSCARFTGFAAGNHTVKYTITSATGGTNIVAPQVVMASPASSTLNPYVIAVSPNQQSSANAGAPYAATYAGYIQTIAGELASDGENVQYADTSNALLNAPTCGNGNQVAMFANCYGGDGLHPTNPGYLVMNRTILAKVPASKLLAVSSWNVTQAAQNFLYAGPMNPNHFYNVNPGGLTAINGQGYTPGLSLGCPNGQCAWIGAGYSGTGLTIANPGTISLCTQAFGTGTLNPYSPLASQCAIQILSNGAINVTGFLWNLNDGSGSMPSGTATSATNFRSRAWNWSAGVWRTDTGTAVQAGPGFEAIPTSPTPGGQNPTVYLTFGNYSGLNLNFGIDLSASNIVNHLGTADATSLSVTSLTVNGNPIGTTIVGATGSIGGSALAAGACASTTVAVAGVGAGSRVTVTPEGGTPGGAFYWRGYPSGSGNINVEVCAAVAGTPLANAYAYQVWE